MRTIDLFEPDDPYWDGKRRDPLDRYYTPEHATEELVRYMGGRIHGDIWEPCCGADMIGRVLRRECDGITSYLGTDVDKNAKTGLWVRRRSGEWQQTEGPFQHDFIGVDNLNDPFDCMITNTPYLIPYPAFANGKADAADFVRRALRYQERNDCLIAMLLRLTWLEPADNRDEIFRLHPPSDVLILKRVHYLNSRHQNMATSCWVVWDPSKQGQTVRWAL